MKKVLIIDDDQGILDSLDIGLFNEGFSTILAATGKEGLSKIKIEKPDIIILDMMLPDIYGLDVLCNLRQWSQLPVIVLSAKEKPIDIISAYRMGADDYITKPFDYKELLGRLNFFIYQNVSDKEFLNFIAGNLAFDFEHHKYLVDNKIIHFSKIEIEIIALLVRNIGKVVKTEEILTEVWGNRHILDIEYVKNNIRKIRLKIEKDPSNPQILTTERGFGYRFNEI